NEIQLADYEVAEPQEINLRDYWDRLLRRKGTVLAVTLGVFILGAFWTFIQKPVYTAKSQLLIEKEPNILSFEQVLQIESMRDDFYQTQYRLLSGRGLADTVIERLKLYENAEFVGRPEKRKKPVDPTDHVFREGLIDEFLERLSVRPVRLTRLVEASFEARDPKLAADCRQRAVGRLHRPQHQHEVRRDRAGDDLPLGADQGPPDRDRAEGERSSRASRPTPTSSP
ncbi:MAG: Wzz/FepE/Etk N-terminal domain-containing protein, partial [Candidatus Moduliflexus flocculans]|nr:Wzz/FepE/Etk N-terminal domain-containing protein [Candidatus Moduliflexus flocculans]